MPWVSGSARPTASIQFGSVSSGTLTPQKRSSEKTTRLAMKNVPPAQPDRADEEPEGGTGERASRDDDRQRRELRP